MEDEYVYISVKLTLRNGQTEGSIQEIVQGMDYSFVHSDILETEIMEILDTQIPDKPVDRTVDPYDMSNLGEF